MKIKDLYLLLLSTACLINAYNLNALSFVAPPEASALLNNEFSQNAPYIDPVIADACSCAIVIKHNVLGHSIKAFQTDEYTVLSLPNKWSESKADGMIVLNTLSGKKESIPMLTKEYFQLDETSARLLNLSFHERGFVIAHTLEYAYIHYIYIYDMQTKKTHKFHIDEPCRCRFGKFYIAPDRTYIIFIPDIVKEHFVYLDLELEFEGLGNTEILKKPGEKVTIAFPKETERKRFSVYSQTDDSVITYLIRKSYGYLFVTEVPEHVDKDEAALNQVSAEFKLTADENITNSCIPLLSRSSIYQSIDEQYIYTITNNKTFLLLRRKSIHNPLLLQALNCKHPIVTLQFLNEFKKFNIFDFVAESKNQQAFFLTLLTTFNALVENFHVINESIDDLDRRINEQEFWQENCEKAAFVMGIMGTDCISLLQGFISKDPYALQRFFDDLTIEHDPDIQSLLRIYYKSLKIKDLSNFHNILKLASAFHSINKKDEYSAMLKPATENHISCEELLASLSHIFLIRLAESLNIPSTNLDKQVIQRFHIPYLSRLKTAMDFIERRFPEKVLLFKGILTSALQNKFHQFISSIKNNSSIGQALALFNQKVRRSIQACGINPFDWLNYHRTVHFNHSDRNLKVDPDDLIISMMKYVVNLYPLLPDNKKSGLSNALKKLDMEIRDNNLHVLSATRPHTKQILSRILTKTENLAKLEQAVQYCLKNSTDQKINELIFHTLDTMKNLRELLVNPEVIKEISKKRKYFKIRMWKREPCHDLFLGDFTGCCLATNSNSHFEAMIDHLIDHGIQVAEVIDEDTGKTMALAWLFLAKDSANKPYLVIDNIEVNGSYLFMKDMIKTELLKYTVHYASYCNIKTVLAGPFNYSAVSLHDKFKKKPFNLTKIGGYFRDFSYYLEALEVKNLFVIKDNIPSLSDSQKKKYRKIPAHTTTSN